MGQPREVSLRKVFDAVQYILSTGCRWRSLSSEYPPFSTVQNCFCGWRRSGVLERVLVRRVARQVNV